MLRGFVSQNVTFVAIMIFLIILCSKLCFYRDAKTLFLKVFEKYIKTF